MVVVFFFLIRIWWWFKYFGMVREESIGTLKSKGCRVKVFCL